jgi:hypothetical protein
MTSGRSRAAAFGSCSGLSRLADDRSFPIFGYADRDDFPLRLSSNLAANSGSVAVGAVGGLL